MINLNYRYVLIGVLFFMPMLSLAQQVYEGQVIDSVSETPLPAATVSLIKAKLVTGTDVQGYYRLVVNEPIADDTLKFSFVGYKVYKLPVARYQVKMFIALSPANNGLKQVNIAGSKVKTVVLDKFNVSDIRDRRTKVITPKGIVLDDYYTTPIYTTGTFAKVFEAPQANVKLNTIDLGRRDLDIPADGDDYPLATASKSMRFLVHVILPNATGHLGKTIFTKEVDITDGALRITIDVKGENIFIPTKKFFIAIEWMPVRINEVIQLHIGNKVEAVKNDGSQKLEETAKYTILYQPFLVLFISDVGTVAWQSADNKSWYMRDFRSPHPSQMHPNYNVALSATIIY